jgi:hypothetical protein
LVLLKYGNLFIALRALSARAVLESLHRHALAVCFSASGMIEDPDLSAVRAGKFTDS